MISFIRLTSAGQIGGQMNRHNRVNVAHIIDYYPVGEATIVWLTGDRKIQAAETAEQIDDMIYELCGDIAPRPPMEQE